jgi:hypothetical protein
VNFHLKLFRLLTCIYSFDMQNCSIETLVYIPEMMIYNTSMIVYISETTNYIKEMINNLFKIIAYNIKMSTYIIEMSECIIETNSYIIEMTACTILFIIGRLLTWILQIFMKLFNINLDCILKIIRQVTVQIKSVGKKRSFAFRIRFSNTDFLMI